MSFSLSLTRAAANVYSVTITTHIHARNTCLVRTNGPARITILGSLLSYFLSRSVSGTLERVYTGMFEEAEPISMLVITEGVARVRVESEGGGEVTVFDRQHETQAAVQLGQIQQPAPEQRGEAQEEEEEEYIPPSP
ncbi:hypothetical protein QBC32DRAFT_225176 [Pseudoneurospora amorphoporcata]|uniref:Uncharacterized protein n=1 Tax=Pseudoneurospora amorphoporcata TaxID=241081 RepID=A0AAN6NK11_9PEZI|nr:hypothetical protein QBC32DRAFT_225176 [Pseudoneurospora amorphoporcata]